MKCGRISDWDLADILAKEVNSFIAEWPECPPVMAAYDILHRKQGQMTPDIVQEINTEFNAAYDSNVYGKWRRGVRPVRREVESYMRAEVLRCLFGKKRVAGLLQALGEGNVVDLGLAK